tara:strand:- start:241 stop:489 length:249 start_codon:yes stop_codon:yes gene_type:complete
MTETASMKERADGTAKHRRVPGFVSRLRMEAGDGIKLLVAIVVDVLDPDTTVSMQNEAKPTSMMEVESFSGTELRLEVNCCS